jgi:hypothetical protein
MRLFFSAVFKQVGALCFIALFILFAFCFLELLPAGWGEKIGAHQPSITLVALVIAIGAFANKIFWEVFKGIWAVFKGSKSGDRAISNFPAESPDIVTNEQSWQAVEGPTNKALEFIICGKLEPVFS